MINVFVKGQNISVSAPTIASDTIDYLQAGFHFQTADWDGATKAATFEKGEEKYNIILENDKITKDKHLNLSTGEWIIGVTGTFETGERITTIPAKITVAASVAKGKQPFPDIPPTMTEQILNKAESAKQTADSVRADADAGEFNGADGADGKSAYEIAIENGFTGTEQEWLESLKGKSGTTNYNELTNKPKINGVELDGNKTSEELGIGGGGITVDTELSETSVNPVQNKVITQAINKKADIEKDWKLIETINVEISAPFDKSITPEGVPYSFSAIAVTFDFPARESDINTKAIYIRDEGYNTTQIGYMHTNSKSRMFAEAIAEIKNAYIDSHYFSPTQGQYAYSNASVPGYFYHFKTKAIGKISRVWSGGDIPAGSVVKIYAIK